MKNKFDKKIEDLGWEKMQALLDKEKPIVGIVPPQYIDQKSSKNGSFRKRWALMALLFLGLSACGGWSYYFFKIKPETQPEIVIDHASAIEKNGQNLPSISQNTEGGKSNLTQQLNPDNGDISTSNKSKSLLNENKITTQNVDNQLVEKSINANSLTQDLDSNKEIKGNLKENEEQIIDKKMINGSNALNAVISDDKTQNNEEKFVKKNALENIDKIGEKVIFESFNPLVFEPINDTVSSIDKRENPIINLKENAQKMLQKWQFGLTLGAHTEGVQRLDGYQTGLILRKNLTQKWAISTGLNYRKASTKSRQNASFLTAEKANNSTSVTTPASSFNLSKVIEVRLKDMKYLEMPIIFDHLVNRRLTVFSGLKMSYLLSKNWVKIDTTNANLYVITYGNQSNKVYSSSSSISDKSSSNSVNKAIDFAILGGINYRISRHFDVSVRYDFGLKNIFKQNNASVYNRYLGLNVNYYF